MAIFQKVLVAYDGSSNSKRALEKASEFIAADESVKMHVINIVNPPHLDLFSLYGPGLSKEVIAKMEEANKEIMAKAKELIKDYKDNCHFEQLEGDAAQKIIDYSKENEIDLIIIGSRGLGTFKGVLLGSVSQRIVQLAEPHVMVIR